MKKFLLILFALFASFSCAKKTENKYVRCQLYMEFDQEGHRVNAFWDIDRNEKVDVSTCDEIHAADNVYAQ